VTAGPHHARLRAQAHACQEHVHLRAERLEGCLQQQVLLEAVAAAAFPHELALEVLHLQRHPQALVRVEILEGDRGQVRPVHLRDARAPIQADPLQVGVQVEHARTLAAAVASRGRCPAKIAAAPSLQPWWERGHWSRSCARCSSKATGWRQSWQAARQVHKRRSREALPFLLSLLIGTKTRVRIPLAVYRANLQGFLVVIGNVSLGPRA
jgi:hypothetical protein